MQVESSKQRCRWLNWVLIRREIRLINALGIVRGSLLAILLLPFIHQKLDFVTSPSPSLIVCVVIPTLTV
ncbi:hypothetical protein [Undibacterium macrobrachii]|uniref:hypothetical protein n=1 Tax=Undibacterium macrobrachii TaxID=1119058 RepID=UPI001673800E|nr:hypothetical protein [Undibacterium macrobrachii]